MPQAETPSTGQGPAASEVAGDIPPARCSSTAPKQLWLHSPRRGRKTSGCFAATNLRHNASHDGLGLGLGGFDPKEGISITI